MSQTNDTRAAARDEKALWDATFPRLLNLSRWALGNVQTGAGDYTDAVSSTLRTYLRRKGAAAQPLPTEPDELWDEIKPLLWQKINRFGNMPRYKTHSALQVGIEVNHLLDGHAPSPEDVDGFIRLLNETFEESLTDPLQIEIARLMMHGCTRQQIATRLGMSIDKVGRQISKIRARLRRTDEGRSVSDEGAHDAA